MAGLLTGADEFQRSENESDMSLSLCAPSYLSLSLSLSYDDLCDIAGFQATSRTPGYLVVLRFKATEKKRNASERLIIRLVLDMMYIMKLMKQSCSGIMKLKKKKICRETLRNL